MYLALDQSLAHTGWALYWPEPALIWSGEHRTKASSELWSRLESIEKLLEHFQALGVTQVISEQIFGSHKVLIQVETAVKLACRRLELPCDDIPANPQRKASWRRQVGLTNGDKKAVIAWATGHWPANLNSHQADALGILVGWLKLNQPEAQPLQASLVNLGYKLHRLEWTQNDFLSNAENNQFHSLRNLREVSL